MAELLGKDEATYSKEKNSFLRDLRHFHDTRGTPFKRCPTFGGKEIDLYLLYSLVTAEGGWIKVNARNCWTEIWQQLDLPPLCVNSSVALKQTYLRYLDRWEKVHFLGEDGDRASDDDEESRHKRWSARVLHAIPHAYLYSQHNVSEEKRDLHHLDTNLYKQSDYDRLALSLISSLPNEQDFAINVCTLLSNDNRNNLKLEKHPRIINYLLAHAGIFNHSSLRQVFVHAYNEVRKKPIFNFWKDVLEFEELLDLTNETKFYGSKEDLFLQPCDTIIKDDYLKYAGLECSTTSGVAGPSRVKNRSSSSDSSSSSDCELIDDNNSVKFPKHFKLKFNASDAELYNLKRTLGTQDYAGQRVMQVATILRNLSFVEDNVPVLSKSTTFVRFLLLCACSQWGNLKNLGLDMLGNIAAEFELKDVQSDLLAASLLKVISKNLQSDDRAACLSSIEVLNKLSQNDRNEDVLLRALESSVYKKVCSFLTIHDVMLLIYTLECLYSLSSLGERACNYIASTHGVIDTLMSLVTVEGKSYGPKACIGMKLVETIPSGSQLTAQQNQSSQTALQQQSATSSSTFSTLSTVTVSTVITSMANSPPAPSVTPVKVISTITTTPVRTVTLAPQRILNTTTLTNHQTDNFTSKIVTTLVPIGSNKVSPQLTPQQLIQKQHAHQQAIQEDEQFALAWLRATYEPCSAGIKIDHQELYKHYLNSCSKIGRVGVISPLHFPRCVRSVFGGTVGPNPMKPANSKDPQYYDGIKVRAQPFKLNIPPPNSPQTPQKPPLIPSSPAAPAAAAAAAPINKQSVVCRKPKITTTCSIYNKPLAVDADEQQEDVCSGVNILLPSPASPILKAQLSAPPKQIRESSSSNNSALVASSDSNKSQAMAHPHLSHALLLGGSSSSSSSTSSSSTAATSSTSSSIISFNSNKSQMEIKQEIFQTAGGLQSNSSSSLIKSLLATKVKDACLPSVSMKTASPDCQSVGQVAARQQRLLSQQLNSTPEIVQQKDQNRLQALKMHRINGARNQLLFNNNSSDQQQNDVGVGDSAVSSTTQFISSIKGKKEPPQPPPPPLAPLSNNNKSKTPPIIVNNEDSDSLGNHSLSSTSGLGGTTVEGGGGGGGGIVSSTEENDNSLTSFEGLLNGIPIVEDTLNESSSCSNSKDSVTNSHNNSDCISIDKPLRLADLLEKKIDNKTSSSSSTSLLLNGSLLNKDLKLNIISEKSDLIENHIEKALSGRENNEIKLEIAMDQAKNPIVELMKPIIGMKREMPDEESSIKSEAKKPRLETTNVNGDLQQPTAAADSSSPQNEERPTTTVSTAAAKLFADFAADILEDEDEDQLMQEPSHQNRTQNIVEPTTSQLIVDNNPAPPQQVLLTPQPRQIIVSQPQISTNQQVVITSGTQIKTASGQTVIVNAGMQQRQSVLFQPNTGQLVLSQGQVQLVQSSQSGQYLIQTNSSQGYVVAQPQTTMVHGQPQTVLLAQNQGAGGSKTIIILQPQHSGSATHHQKVVVPPQGQQMIVTQVQRPLAQSSAVSNINQQTTKISRPTPSASPALSNASTSSSNASNGTKEKPPPPPPPPEDLPPRFKIIRDLTTAFVCEWGDCVIETKFKSPNQVYMHACEMHCPQGDEEVFCLWDRCDALKRKRFSLMTHLHDKHCNSETMTQSLVRRKKVSQGINVDPPTPATSTSHPGYAPDAALHAIKRHALEFVNPKELQDDNEGPVTKSIRLTASLILRNLVIYSSNCKRYLKSYESHLANIALSNVESSRTVAQILYDMNDGTANR